MNKPTRLLDPAFRYVPARETDIRKTFARVRRELAQAEQARQAVVTPIKRRT